jgi:hypothetical protein
MEKRIWSITFFPGRGWHSVSALRSGTPEERSMAWARNPLLPRSKAILISIDEESKMEVRDLNIFAGYLTAING